VQENDGRRGLGAGRCGEYPDEAGAVDLGELNAVRPPLQDQVARGDHLSFDPDDNAHLAILQLIEARHIRRRAAFGRAARHRARPQQPSRIDASVGSVDRRRVVNVNRPAGVSPIARLGVKERTDRRPCPGGVHRNRRDAIGLDRDFRARLKAAHAQTRSVAGQYRLRPLDNDWRGRGRSGDARGDQTAGHGQAEKQVRSNGSSDVHQRVSLHAHVPCIRSGARPRKIHQWT
jgi:hypothetical protein